MIPESCKKSAEKNYSADETVYRLKVSFDERKIVSQAKCCIEKNILKALKTIDTASEK